MNILYGVIVGLAIMLVIVIAVVWPRGGPPRDGEGDA